MDSGLLGKSSLCCQKPWTPNASVWTTGHLRSRPRSQRSPCSPSWSMTMTWSEQTTSSGRPRLTWRIASTANTEPSVACRASTRCEFFRNPVETALVFWDCGLRLPMLWEGRPRLSFSISKWFQAAGLAWRTCSLHLKLAGFGVAIPSRPIEVLPLPYKWGRSRPHSHSLQRFWILLNFKM